MVFFSKDNILNSKTINFNQINQKKLFYRQNLLVRELRLNVEHCLRKG